MKTITWSVEPGHNYEAVDSGDGKVCLRRLQATDLAAANPALKLAAIGLIDMSAFADKHSLKPLTSEAQQLAFLITCDGNGNLWYTGSLA